MFLYIRLGGRFCCFFRQKNGQRPLFILLEVKLLNLISLFFEFMNFNSLVYGVFKWLKVVTHTKRDDIVI